MEPAKPLTQEQSEALHIVRNILGNIIDPTRVTYGTAKTYFPIVLDGDRWKTICRLYQHERLMVGTINERRVETKTRIGKAEDLLQFAHEIKAVANKYR
ncbi:MAG: hypothetical protein EOO51_08100 [Flavobacterium sp.]|nr:MAG: hypothetical protein EOO51_08100 [Flavobacterium sp.]